jgi:2-(1,2-epoxy-1,2-dihydrophenyl)acetyl-CoA isomerase
LAEELLHEVIDSVARITLNRPEVKNALAPDQRDRMIELLEDAGDDGSIRCVVITGAGGSFCSGADLRGSSAPSKGTVADLIKEGAQRLIASIMDCPKPVLAAVDGVAAGIGAHMAFACDLIVASEQARFIEVFSRRALVPDGGGAYLLTRLVGPQKAKELVFFGDSLSAGEAKHLGLVNRVVSPDELEGAVGEWTTRLASGPTRTLGMAKKLINEALDTDREASFEAEARAQEENMKTADAQEGVQSFRERRDPKFRGK